MKKISYLLLVGALVACNPAKKETESKEVPAAESKVEERVPTAVLNPNLSSKEDLLGISGMTDAKANLIITGRPYLSSMAFIIKLSTVVGEDQVEEVTKRLFLPMNLNEEEEADFMNIPGVGKKMAHEFEEYRPYTSWEQFRREIGKYVDEAQVAEYEKYVFVPVNLNTASKEDIMRIPGMGDRMHHEFEEYRPYENMEQFRREIGKYVDDDELARLERYVTL